MARQLKYYIYTFLLFGFLGISLTTLISFSSLYLHETASILITMIAFVGIYFWHPFRYFSLLSQSISYLFLLVFVVSLWQYSSPFWQTWQGKTSDVISVEEAYKQQDNFTFFRLKNAQIHQSQLGTQEYQTIKHHLHGSVEENHLIFLVPVTDSQSIPKNFKVWLGESFNNDYTTQNKNYMSNLKTSYSYFMKHPDTGIFQDVLDNNNQNKNSLILMPVDAPQKMLYANLQSMFWIIVMYWLITSICIALVELSMIFRHKKLLKRVISPTNY